MCLSQTILPVLAGIWFFKMENMVSLEAMLGSDFTHQYQLTIGIVNRCDSQEQQDDSQQLQESHPSFAKN